MAGVDDKLESNLIDDAQDLYDVKGFEVGPADVTESTTAVMFRRKVDNCNSTHDRAINEGSTKRKEILAKFLDLDQFEKKFRASKNDSIETRALLKKLLNWR